MGYPANLGLVDKSGNPLEAHIQRVLRELLPRFRRAFADLNDETVIVEVLEEAGRRIAERERQRGPIERLHGYAWVVVRSVAVSRLRRSSTKVATATVGQEESEAILGSIPADLGSPSRIESEVLFREALNELNDEERRICIWKTAGFSSKEIARYRGGSAAAVDTLFHRARRKIREFLSGPDPDNLAGSEMEHDATLDTGSAANTGKIGRARKVDEEQ